MSENEYTFTVPRAVAIAMLIAAAIFGASAVAGLILFTRIVTLQDQQSKEIERGRSQIESLQQTNAKSYSELVWLHGDAAAKDGTINDLRLQLELLKQKEK